MSPRGDTRAREGALPARVMRYTGGSVIAFTTNEVVLGLWYATKILGTTEATGWAEHAGDGNKAMVTAAVAAAYLVTYGVLFVMKFAIFETIVFVDRADAR
jgi:hypothetical protein